ncbi:hypothetical protein K469DRAFT_715823, partial [Zopfia rhizophila CBS 207.26]
MRSFGTEISGNRGRNDKLSPKAHAAIISKRKAGVLRKDLAAEFRVSEKTITNTLKRWKSHNTLTMRREKQEAGLLQLHKATIYQILKEKGLTNHRCKKRPKLNAAVRALRLKFCQEYHHFNWKRRG